MANGIFNVAKKQLLSGAINLTSDTIKVALVKSDYVFDADQAAIDDGTVNDVQSHEISVGGYSRKTLANRVFAQDNTNDFGYVDADDTVFPALVTGQTIGGVIVYKDTGVDTTSIPIAFFDTTDTPTNGSDITIQWATVALGAVLKAS